ncbi:MAG: cofactor-independent phosphoglycerate mutase [Abditibacteriota bacterium]|nr:cofactor-independent phosphoglycerate mutase [Abditibacteriota bacterium]
MKHFLIIFDGMADEPNPVLDGKTPMQVAYKPNMDKLAAQGIIGKAFTTPQGMMPGSDVTNMGILGFDPKLYYSGRGSIEAASLGIPMTDTDAVFRANLVSTDGEVMLDSSAGHITDEEAAELMKAVQKELGGGELDFFPGVSYRNIAVWHDGSADVHCYAPYKFIGERLDAHKPEGTNADKMWEIMTKSRDVLKNHPVNLKRAAEGKLPADMLWFWGESTKPAMDSFKKTFGKEGAVVAAVDLIKGIGRLAGLEITNVPGATGYIDTNYKGKGEKAVEQAKKYDFVWTHVEAPDESGHEKSADKKIAAIESCDKDVLGTILDFCENLAEPYKILLMPDHPTPIATGNHTANPVPFILFDSRRDMGTTLPYDERALPDCKLVVTHTPSLMRMLLSEE